MSTLCSRLIATTLGSMLTCASMAAPAVSGEATAHVEPVNVGPLSIGNGRPRIIVSTTAADEAGVLQQAQAVADTPEADLLELRVDKLGFATDASRVATLGHEVVARLRGKPLLLTLRTKAEGGSRTISDDAYTALNRAWLDQGFAQLVDIEMFRGSANVAQLVAQAHARGVKVILSSHQFDTTPPNEEMLKRLAQQEALGADVLKLAVMPQQADDVRRLLDITLQMRQRSEKPLLTIAMGGTGVISRVAGETFGSALTFAALDQPSAPGQLNVKALSATLDLLHQAKGG